MLQPYSCARLQIRGAGSDDMLRRRSFGIALCFVAGVYKLGLHRRRRAGNIFRHFMGDGMTDRQRKKRDLNAALPGKFD